MSFPANPVNDRQRWRNHFESGGPKVYPVFSPTAHNVQLYAYSDFRCFSTSYCKYSMSLKVTGTTQFVLKEVNHPANSGGLQ